MFSGLFEVRQVVDIIGFTIHVDIHVIPYNGATAGAGASVTVGNSWQSPLFIV